jgi:hypothetical protein
MVAGPRERDYYQGKVTQATPEQRAWAEARKAELSQPSSAVASQEVSAR